MNRIVYHVGARVDVLEIVTIYESIEGHELADRFTKELEEFIKHISELSGDSPRYSKGKSSSLSASRSVLR